MCTYCGQHCVEDEPFRLSLKELKSGKRLPENTCPDKDDDNNDKTIAKTYYKVESHNGLLVINSNKPLYENEIINDPDDGSWEGR